MTIKTIVLKKFKSIPSVAAATGADTGGSKCLVITMTASVEITIVAFCV